MMQNIKFFIIGLFLFLIFRTINKLIKSGKIKSGRFGNFRKSLTVIELISWIAFLFWAVREIFQEKFYYTTIISGIIVIVLAIIAYYLFRDYAAGLILKTEFSLEEGKYIKTEKYEGKIIKPGYLSLELESKDKQIYKIPYSEISNKTVSFIHLSENVRRYSTRLTVKKTGNIKKTKHEIKSSILNSPYAVVTENPHIEMISETEKEFIFNIVYYAQNENHAFFIKEKLLKAKFSEINN